MKATVRLQQDVDTSGWLTKPQAAAVLGMVGKTVQKYAKLGRIQEAMAVNQATHKWARVYHPGDVEALRAELHPEPEPFIAEELVIAPGANKVEALLDKVEGFLEKAFEASNQQQRALLAHSDTTIEKLVKELTPPPIAFVPPPPPPPLFLTVGEAARYAGLTRYAIHGLIASGEVVSVATSANRVKISRRSLDEL